MKTYERGRLFKRIKQQEKVMTAEVDKDGLIRISIWKVLRPTIDEIIEEKVEKKFKR